MTKNIKNVDISKLQLNNKMYNIEFLLKKEVFKNLCLVSNSITDTSIAYIPWFNYVSTIEVSKNNFKDVCFLAPCAENNYADLSFINNNMYINVKACRIKTFNAIPMDGNILTYAKNTISDSNFIVFYSINPLESDKIIIMTTNVYNFLVSHNNDKHILYFNAENINKIKKAFNFSDNQINCIDLTKDIILDESYEKNINIKRVSCTKTVYKMKEMKNKSKKLNYNIRTHYGHQYSAFNIISGEIRQFRDTIARNNFFESIGIKLADNHNIIKNCKNMTKIINNEEVESYRTNIHESGWVICEYIADTIELINYVQKLITIVKEKSKRLNERIKMILSMAKQNFILLTNTILQNVQKIKNKFRNTINYFRPLFLLEKTTNYNFNRLKI